MKKLAWFLIVLCSFGLVNLSQTLWSSFENNSWTISYYSWTKPTEVLMWLMSAAVLIYVAVMTAKMHCHHEISAKRSVTIILGTLASTILLVLTEIFSSSLIVLSNNSLKEIASNSLAIFFRWPPLIAYIITGFLNALVGFWFGKPIVVDGGDSTGIKVISRLFLWMAQKIRDRKKAKEEKEAEEQKKLQTPRMFEHTFQELKKLQG